MTFEQILKDIKARKFAPVYLLHGEEPYFIDEIASLLESTVLNDAEKSFNQTIVYGRDAELRSLTDMLRRFPMMAEKQVVILREAQAFRQLEQLEAYFDQPSESTVFIICHKYKKVDARKKAFKKLTAKASSAVVLESKKLREYEVSKWLTNYLAGRNLRINEPTARLLQEHLGTDLSRIVNSLEKIIVNLQPSEHTITPDHIEKYIGISKEYNAFELVNALLHRDGAKAFRIIRYFEANPKAGPIQMIIPTLLNPFSKLYMLSEVSQLPDRELPGKIGVSPYFLKDYKRAIQYYPREKTEAVIGLLQEYDMKSKGVDSTQNDAALLKELIYKILN